jgi:hypothetical protein
MHFLLPFDLRVGWSCCSRWQCQRRVSTWVMALKSKVTLLSTIIALLALWVLGCSLVGWGALSFLISSILGASIGEMANLSPIETYRGCFSWRRTFFVVGCCLYCTYLLCLANIILDVTLPLSWWGSYFHRLCQLIDVLHLRHDLLYGLKKLSFDDQQML